MRELYLFIEKVGRRCLPAFFVAIMVLAAAISPVGAHFLLNLNVRIFHVDHVTDGLILHMRTPMPYLVAEQLGEVADDSSLPAPAPFTSNAREAGQLVHFVDLEQLSADPLGLGRIAEEAILIEVGGVRLRGAVERVALYQVGTEPGFATLDEAREALDTPWSTEMLPRPLYAGDAIVDVRVRYPARDTVSAYTISSTLNPGLNGQEQTANLILDYGPGEPKVFRSRGLLTEPVEITRSRLSAISTFVWEGGRHILEGLDHVLFVVCLVLGARTLRSLLWRVTGFTIGHSVTLALGFFGFVPKSAWFVPAVETSIALSIIYAAAVAMRSRGNHTASERLTFLVTTSIGLLHGLGFSFVLQKILQITSPNIWQSLLAFNVGVELGQVLIVLAIWPALYVITRRAPILGRIIRFGTGFGCIGISLFWAVERTKDLLVTMS